MEAVGEEEGTVVADGREEARDVHEEEAFESASSFSKTKMSSAGLLCRLLVSCGGCSCSCGCGGGCGAPTPEAAAAATTAAAAVALAAAVAWAAIAEALVTTASKESGPPTL